VASIAFSIAGFSGYRKSPRGEPVALVLIPTSCIPTSSYSHRASIHNFLRCASPWAQASEATSPVVADHIAEKRSLLKTIAMRKVMMRMGCAVLTFLLGTTSATILRVNQHIHKTAAPASSLETSQSADADSPCDEFGGVTDAFVDTDHLVYNGYEIDRLQRTEKDQFTLHHEVDVSFVVIKKDHVLLSKFDLVRGPMGVSADFGMHPFLHGNEQLLISQDIFRGGRQWIVSFYPRYQVIFDGRAWEVGRESYDMQAIDLDDDRELELIVPLTFYDFQDKMLPSKTPMPKIIFKYNPLKERYFPVNHVFTECALSNTKALRQQVFDTDAQLSVSDSLSILFDYVYAGKETEGWAFFNRHYNLPDKKEIVARVRADLKTQPIYRYLYEGVTPKL